MEICITPGAVQRQRVAEIEGPSRRQAVRMAERRRNLIAQARTHEDRGRPVRAFDLDCQAWDIERDLVEYGFAVDSGRPIR